MRVNVVRAFVILLVAAVGPDRDVLDGDVRARGARGAVDVNRWSLSAVGNIAGPVFEGNAVVLDAYTGLDGFAGPVAVDVERVGVFVSDEVLEENVGDGSVAAVVLELVGWSVFAMR